MAKIEDILGNLQSGTNEDGKNIPTITVDDQSEPGEVVSGLMRYFGDDDERNAVKVIYMKEQAGIITRNALYNLVSVSNKGIGSFEPLILPGRPEFKPMVFRCPIAGCDESELVIHVTPGSVRRCPKHPDTEMELARESG